MPNFPSTPHSFVYGIITMAEGASERTLLLVSQTADWVNEGRLSDYYEDADQQFLDTALLQLGFDAEEMDTSTYALHNLDAVSARNAIGAIEGFEHDSTIEERFAPVAQSDKQPAARPATYSVQYHAYLIGSGNRPSRKDYGLSAAQAESIKAELRGNA
jgi:hypothetical protein